MAAKALGAIAGLAVWTLSVATVAAQDSGATTNAPDAVPAPVPGAAKPVQLSYGARNVLNLARAHVSEGTIISFIEGSEMDYPLNAAEIIYLREQGVSDRVVTTMLNQRAKVAEARVRAALRAEPEVAEPPSTGDPNAGGPAPAATAGQPTTFYVQTAPVVVAPSTDYVIPNPATPYYEYGWYPGYAPYYDGDYGNWRLGLGLSLGFGIGDGFGFGGDGFRGRRWDGFRRGGDWGGFHGGGFGGGQHGGGGSGGHR